MRYFKSRSINFVMVGTTFLILSALLTSGSNVYYSSNVQGISPFTFTFVSFLVTAVFFQLTLVGNPNKGNIENSTHRKDLVGINFSTAGVFMCFYLALKYIEPAIVGAIEIGIGPIASLIIVKTFYKKSVDKIDIFTGMGALAGSLYLVIATLNGNSGIEFQSMTHAVIGLIAASLSGVFASLAAIYSKNLSQANWSSRRILAHRFYAIIVLSFILSTLRGDILSQLSTNWGWIILVSLFGVAVPLYFLQIGIQYSDTFFVMMSLSFVPIFTFVFQYLDPRISSSQHSLSGIGVILAFALFSVYTNNSKSNSIARRKEKAI